MVWAVLLILLISIITYLLLMPLELYIDSYRGRYYFKMGFLARASVEKDSAELMRLNLRVLFMNFFWRPSDFRRWGKQKKKSTQKSGKKRHMTLGQGKRLLNSFRIKAFRMELDTGNPVLNAQLFPFSHLSGQPVGKVGINYLGCNNMLLQITNRPIYILNAFINPKK